MKYRGKSCLTVQGVPGQYRGPSEEFDRTTAKMAKTITKIDTVFMNIGFLC